MDAALPSEPAPAHGRWARVSDHPAPFGDDNKIVTALHESPHVLTDAERPRSSREAEALDASAIKSQPTAPIEHANGSDIAVAATNAATTASAVDVRGNTNSLTSQVRRPPVLASEALLRDIAPPRPARKALRLWCPLLGVVGATNAWMLTHGHGLGWLLASAFVALALLGLPPMPYSGRASAVTTISASSLVLLLCGDNNGPGSASRVMLTVSVTLLAAGLYFRAWHRASGLSRFIVASGLILATLFLWLGGGLADLTLSDTTWQSWLPRLLGLAFGMLLLLSLLAFMDARSTGGAAVWASSILCWNALYAVVTILETVWPSQVAMFDLSRISDTSLLAWTSTPLLTALLSIGAAQLMASGVAGATRRRNDISTRPPPSLRDFTAPAPRSH
ncbi:MAG: hypothetical protein ABW321_05065 [Polyangiales bacterium]